MRPSSPEQARGISLIELVVSSALSGLLLLMVWSIMSSGSRYYKNSNDMLHLQQSTLLALSWMSRELGEGNPISLRDDTDNPDYPGIVFGAPRDEIGEVLFKAGIIQWRSLVAYYLVPEGSTNTLMRAVQGMEDSDYPPVISPDRNTTYFATTGSSSVTRRPIATDIYSLDIVNSSQGLRVILIARDQDAKFSIETQTLLDMKN